MNITIALITICLLLVGVIVGFLGDTSSPLMRLDPEEEIPAKRSLFTSPWRVRFNTNHWHLSEWNRTWFNDGAKKSYCKHSPQVWPWWRLVSFNFVRLEVNLPSMGWRLWVYTRWGALYWDVAVDRRIKK